MTSVFSIRSLMRTAAVDLYAGRQVQIAGVSESLTQLLLVQLALGDAEHVGRQVVVVVPTAKDLTPWLHAMSTLAGAVSKADTFSAAVLPSISPYGNDRFINHHLARRQRLFALAHMLYPAGPTVILTTAVALAQMTLHPRLLQGASLQLKAGAELDQDQLLAALDDLGYLPAASVTEEGTFAVRGGIVDIFPPNLECPIRLEFTFDQLASLRAFSAVDQKSTRTLGEVLVIPADESLMLSRERKADAQRLFNLLLEQQVNPADRDGMLSQFQQGLKFSGFDMLAPLFRSDASPTLDSLGPHATLLFPQSIDRCIESYRAFYAATEQSLAQDIARHRPTLPIAAHFIQPDDFVVKLRAVGSVLEFGNPFASPEALFYRLDAKLNLPGAPLASSPGTELFDKWSQVLARYIVEEGGKVAILAPHAEQVERVVNLLQHRGLSPVVEDGLVVRLVQGTSAAQSLSVGLGELAGPLWFEEEGLLVLPDTALFGPRPRRTKPAAQKLQNFLNSFADLKTGDLVVHVQHGIGRYSGLTSLAVAGLASDFLLIEYAGGDKVYLPVDRMNLLQRYNTGGEGSAQQLVDRLGGPAWERRKAKAKGAIHDMAEELLKLQALRAIAPGHIFAPPDAAYLEFEAAFPYDETPDQLRAIAEVDADLVSGKPMDRLICGDVGFGKTEVALRAAMRTVLEGMQVLILVPTTVLCYQHYRTFSQRLERHGVRVAQVNRFVNAVDTKQALAGLSSGQVDILVGTHRMLSKDIKPSRLGLVVVDEEQRFGVSHKEKLKELRAGAHVLTLTATPIPRTLHMAMIGMRDISIIATPPEARLAVKTYISKADDALIREAIEHEVRRGGQVFYVHNRVEDIAEVGLHIKSLVPFAEVRVGHGQMPEHQLEKVIVDFIEQKFQVLVCTTIIESGIDMPNVNTLIVSHAHRFGLAQLYQLRGRVGRANLQAFAYFLTPGQERLSPESWKRLEVLGAHQELGAGFQIASHDLELRGAGNLLGGEQSGYATSVGLELYTEMLEDAIHALRGEEVPERFDTEIKIPVSAFIAASFVPQEAQRLQLYKRLFAADGEEALRGLRREIVDRFGELPSELVLLFKVARIKQQLKQINAIRLTAGKGVFEIRCAPLSDQRIDRVLKVVAHQPGRYKLAPDGRILLFHDFSLQPSLAEQDAMLTALVGLISPLTEAFE